MLLSTKNLRLKRPSKKLSDKYVGPFKVKRVTGSGLAYELELPPSWKIFNVFHVSLLEPYTQREGNDEPPPPPELIDDEFEYTVESIIDHRERTNGRQYLVRWAGYTAADDTWEPPSYLKRAQGAIEDYEKTAPRKRQRIASPPTPRRRPRPQPRPQHRRDRDS